MLFETLCAKSVHPEISTRFYEQIFSYSFSSKKSQAVKKLAKNSFENLNPPNSRRNCS